MYKTTYYYTIECRPMGPCVAEVLKNEKSS